MNVYQRFGAAARHLVPIHRDMARVDLMPRDLDIPY